MYWCKRNLFYITLFVGMAIVPFAFGNVNASNSDIGKVNTQTQIADGHRHHHGGHWRGGWGGHRYDRDWYGGWRGGYNYYPYYYNRGYYSYPYYNSYYYGGYYYPYNYYYYYDRTPGFSVNFGW